MNDTIKVTYNPNDPTITVEDVQKMKEKMDPAGYVALCPFCDKPFDHTEYMEHLKTHESHTL